MKKAIEYGYYKPYEIEHLKNILEHLANEFNIKESKVRDSLNGYIRSFNISNELGCSDELLKILYNNGYKLSLKDFIERIVLYLIRIKKKDRFF